MTILHARWRRRVSLLAAGALEDDERERSLTLTHLESCEACRSELAAVRAFLADLEADPYRRGEVSIPVEVMVAQVQAEVGRALTSPQGLWGWRLVGLAAAAASIVAVSLAVPRAREWFPRATPSSPLVVEAVSEETIDRLERAVVREQTARYLTDAQDVLVTVTSMPPLCRKESRDLDLADETARSRMLLSRRQLLVGMDSDDVAIAGPVLNDVEDLLREVAALPACTKREDLDVIQREMSRRNLLMKIDLTTRELQG